MIRTVRVLLAFVTAAGLVAVPQRVAAADPAPAIEPQAGPRPLFQLPFPCEHRWLAFTRADHSPNPNSLDMTKVNDESKNEPILASFAGRVVRAEWDDGGGWFVRIDHGAGWQTRYLHMVERPEVREGQAVRRGQRIGRVGSSGNSSGPHLHYEQIRDGETVRSAFNNVPVEVEVGRSQILTSLNCDHRTAGDYDGDGASDLALYRSSDGTWWVRSGRAPHEQFVGGFAYGGRDGDLPAT